MHTFDFAGVSLERINQPHNLSLCATGDSRAPYQHSMIAVEQLLQWPHGFSYTLLELVVLCTTCLSSLLCVHLQTQHAVD